ncbi:MAG: hypothetical protein H6502_02265 [Candidatus Woesearchaeota archaeon]|nr:MAG: hypothetical protein H6502_02265 [Candidatus Woesearchaeota archaeon]
MNDRQEPQPTSVVMNGMYRGLWFGKLVVKILEYIIPPFRDKEENLIGFQNYYLNKFNLSNKERLKRAVKELVKIVFGITFWTHGILLSFLTLFKFFNPSMMIHPYAISSSIFMVLFLTFSIFLVLYIFKQDN